jgi:ATP-binding cassette subfamily F protein 3
VAVEGRTLLEDFTVRLPRGEAVGLVGPNGAGKSTLLKTLMGERGPAAGLARLGPGTRAAYYRQDLAQVPLDKPLYDIISDLKPQWERRIVQGHLGRFGFSGDEVQRTANTLSGGERARVALAMLMLTGANLLILDEPTNHLDVESIEVLEDALEEYDGTVILVSHDRALLRASATTVWALEDERIDVFDGSFPEWEEREGERRAQRAARQAEAEQRRRAREKAEAERKSAEEAVRARASAAAGTQGRGASRDASRDDRRQARELERRAREAEASVQQLEARVAALTTALDDPTLYDTVNGAAKAADLGRELDAAQRGLEAAMTEWAEATEALEARA